MTDPTPETTPTRDEAVQPCEMATHILRIAIEDRQATDTVEMNVGDLSVMLGLLLASAPTPASGGVDAVAVRTAATKLRRKHGGNGAIRVLTSKRSAMSQSRCE